MYCEMHSYLRSIAGKRTASLSRAAIASRAQSLPGSLRRREASAELLDLGGIRPPRCHWLCYCRSFPGKQTFSDSFSLSNLGE